LTGDLWQALAGADCAALVTRHREYEALDLGRLRDTMGGSVLVDGRNVFDLGACAQAGLVYRGVGKGK
jgi:UDP-N-acetyl-D-mannosaminuronate dehydrogenase